MSDENKVSKNKMETAGGASDEPAQLPLSPPGQLVKIQTRDLEQFAQARGWHLIDSYLDTGISGSKDSRPELNRLMADAHKRRFDVVVVWRFDRFARSVSHLLRRSKRST